MNTELLLMYPILGKLVYFLLLLSFSLFLILVSLFLVGCIISALSALLDLITGKE